MRSSAFLYLAVAFAIGVAAGLAGPVLAQNEGVAIDEVESSSYVSGDALVFWRSGQGATIAWRGIPLFSANSTEFTVHQKWQKVLYRNSLGEPRATLEKTPDGSVLSIRDRTENFDFEKRIISRNDGSLRLEYEYELLEPEEAEIQVLFGISNQWIDKSKYKIVIDGKEREGELSVPATGRIDPWGGATEQTFTTEFGVLHIKSERPLNILCEPANGALWYAQPLVKGTRYTQAIDVQIEPGEAANTGISVKGIEWPERVRDGLATFDLILARTEGGPKAVTLRVEHARAGRTPAGEPVVLELGDQPAAAKVTGLTQGKGRVSMAVVIADADTQKELLRLSPLVVDAAPYMGVLPRYSLFTGEQGGEVIVDVADDVELDGLTISLSGEGLPQTQANVQSRRMFVPFDLAAIADGATDVKCVLARGDETLSTVTTRVRKAPPAANEVKIDNASGGLIADGLPFIPFGFYTYYPLADDVMDGEVVNGFNLFSPYHRGPHTEEDLGPIREYMDRCAAIGMKVNYHVMWANRRTMTEENWAQLRMEIEAFRNHPALLTWYTADEPTADRVPHLEEVNKLIKELDPYHPVTVVFYRGADHARQFTDTMDIVMGDPYPMPRGKVTAVSSMSDALYSAFEPRKPLWIVPQAFGGNEWWPREPTAKEQRVMTYLALIHNARGIQYFIRSPKVSFPKSPIMWGECGRLALEAAELTPALMSVEPRPEVTASLEQIHVTAFRDRGRIVVLAVNTVNEPAMMRVELPGVDFTGEAEVLFEDRNVAVQAGAVEEFIDAYGTRAYSIPVGPEPEGDIDIDPRNMTENPSWESQPSVGTASGCYASIPAGATALVDSRLARHGRHSLRMTAPTEEQRPSIRAFPVALKAGQEYRLSIWAKGKSDGVLLDVSLGELGKEQFVLDTTWKEYSFTIKPGERVSRSVANIGLGSAGVAWLDLLQVVPVDAGEEQ